MRFCFSAMTCAEMFAETRPTVPKPTPVCSATSRHDEPVRSCAAIAAFVCSCIFAERVFFLGTRSMHPVRRNRLRAARSRVDVALRREDSPEFDVEQLRRSRENQNPHNGEQRTERETQSPHKPLPMSVSVPTPRTCFRPELVLANCTR